MKYKQKRSPCQLFTYVLTDAVMVTKEEVESVCVCCVLIVTSLVVKHLWILAVESNGERYALPNFERSP